MTLKAVGEALDVNQPAVTGLERPAEMYLSTLRAYIEAVGGRLGIVAEFPQGSVVITNFLDAGESREAGHGQALNQSGATDGGTG